MGFRCNDRDRHSVEINPKSNIVLDTEYEKTWNADRNFISLSIRHTF